jgi:hypothetical protein
MNRGRTVEMPGAWKTRKTKPKFPFVSHSPRKSLRDFHIPTAPARRGKVENQNQVSHFPTCCSLFQTNPERRPWRRILHSHLQAHSSMRKCCSNRSAAQMATRGSWLKKIYLKSFEWHVVLNPRAIQGY